MKNVFELMTTGLGKIASRAFKPNTLEIFEAGFGKIRGSNPRIARTMAIPSRTHDEVGPVTAGNVKTRGPNPRMSSGTCPFPESDEPRSIGVSPFSSMTTEEEGIKAT